MISLSDNPNLSTDENGRIENIYGDVVDDIPDDAWFVREQMREGENRKAES